MPRQTVDTGWTEGLLRCHCSKKLCFNVQVITTTGMTAPEQMHHWLPVEDKLEMGLGPRRLFSSKCL